MANLEVTKSVRCPRAKEIVEIENACVFCDNYTGMNYNENPGNPDLVCTFEEED